MSAGLSFKLTRNDVSPFLSRMARAAKHPEKVFRAMGTTFMSLTMGAFNDVGEEYRPSPWPALKHDQRGGAGKKAGEASNLQLHSVLARSFHLTVSDTGATVSNPTVYAATHQFGRDFGRGSPIPARPFFPVKDGELTPAAAEKIRRAGERQMARDIGAE
ncbi:MAG: phage virion morphogenesis protein [Patescibacteria group bacterium]|nr:phage virion morphogenesis protein [Patescibacteria group bacterium]